MLTNNYANRFRRDVLTRIAKILYDKKPVEDLNRIPYEIINKDDESFRCCIHCDRAVIRARVMAGLGFSLEEFFDEGRSLAEYSKIAFERKKIEAPFLTLLEDACNSCVRSQYLVTNACQGCVARPCQTNCPKHAISMQKKKAEIDGEKCINCGICLKACPYGAIVSVPIPCEAACPVGAITRDEETQKEKIDYHKCIHCGKCLTSCPFGALMERSQIVDVVSRVLKGEKMIAFFAPAIVAQFPQNTPEKMITALKKLGFTDAVEVALGADITTKNEAAEFIHKMQSGQKLMTTSCCPAYYQAVERHIPEIKHAVSETKSPMIYTAQWIDENYPEHKKVFIGPCLAKRSEALLSKIIDYVLSVEELGAMLIAKNVQIAQCEPTEIKNPASVFARKYAITGGVAAAVKSQIPPEISCRCESINGLNKQSIKMLKLYGEGKITNADLLEVMACEGGCVAGPSAIANVKIATKQVADLK